MISKLRVIHNGQIVGHLAENKGEIRFEYTQNWLANGFDLAPGIMPFNGDANEAPSQVFDGLHGAFNDSLPDGWGLLLMDRALKKHKDLDPSQITPLDRLAYMGHRAMGALEYQPELLPEQESNDIDLADIAAKSEIILQGETTEILEAVRLCGGSPGGARPKVTVAFSEDMKSCISNFGILPEGYSHWIVKFRNDNRYGNGDPVDIGRQEIAYAEMARAAGLQMPKTHLVELKVNGKDEAFFAVQRFDRDVNRKIHFLSLSGYLHATHRVPSLEYASGVLAATMKLTKSQAEVEKAFRLMLFNVLAHNKDDHAKNFAYLMDPAANGAWELAPAYDLTFNTGMGNEHMTSISGAGNPDINDIKKVAVARKVKNWEKILEEVRSAVSDWPKYANSFDVPKARIASIQKNLRDIDQRCSPTVARPKPSRK